MEELTVVHIHRLAVKKRDNENVTRVCFCLHDHSVIVALMACLALRKNTVFLRLGRKKTIRSR